MDLYITNSQLQQMITHVVTVLPNEGCGFLAGSSGRVLQVYPVTNMEHSPSRYRMDPEEQIHYMTAIDQVGWQMLGIFHSHPSGPPSPSEIDREQAYYPQAVYVILSLSGTIGWQARGFRLKKKQWVEITLQIEALRSQTITPG